MSQLLDFYQQRTEQIIDLLEQLVRLESPTSSKTDVDKLGRFIEARLTALGADITLFPRESVGDIRLAKWNARATGQPILLLMHIDTVWDVGTLYEMIPWRRDEFKLYGAGVLDMKAGIAIALEAVRGLQERDEMPNRPIWMLFTTDEEKGSLHSRDLIVEIAQQCGLCLVMEPAAENEGIKSSRKGIATYEVSVAGKASHAGNAPEEGVNAIIELAHQMIAINELNNLRKGTSVSVTTMQGGTTGNVIPPRATCYVDVRFFYAEEAQRVDDAIQALIPKTFGANLAVSGGINRYPMERTELVVECMTQAREIAQGLGMNLGESAVGGVSDGNLTAHAGVPTLDGLGGHGEGMHALHEHILIRSLPRRAALLSGILEDWTF